MATYGLIGKNIGYSFSRSYFAAKFEEEQLQHTYVNFDCQCREEILGCLSNTSIKGFNVTIPYKETIVEMLDSLDAHAQAIGAVNTIKRLDDGSLRGYNTDWVGFGESLDEMFVSAFAKAKKTQLLPKRALILGTGGASKAIVYALKKRNITSQYVSRMRTGENIPYQDLDKTTLNDHKLIVNCTPLGTYPDVNLQPDIPYNYLSNDHMVYDLIYNPAETAFLKSAKARGSFTTNGKRMLELQANASWDIWEEG